MLISKRILDIICSVVGLILLSPLLLLFIILIFVQDGHSPFYFASRVGRKGEIFRMVKLRSMVVDADKAGIDTASVNDHRITRLGAIVRKYKIDELFQLWNVLKGEMSLIGPRPNVKSETDLYTTEEKRLLSVKPGISDFSSIVFEDLGNIVAESKNTNLSYNQLVRPWKSRLGLIYIDNISLMLDLKIIVLTLVSFFSRDTALKSITKILENLGAPADLIKVSKRKEELVPTPPPGSNKIVTDR